MSRQLSSLMRHSSSRKGFTLTELLLVIGLLAIIATVIIVGINPTKQLAKERNDQRAVDVKIILDAIHEYSVDHIGRLPPAITFFPREICRSGVNIDCATEGLINLTVLTGSYLPSIPVDPKDATATSTKYTIMAIGNRVTVAAPSAEEGEIISVTR